MNGRQTMGLPCLSDIMIRVNKNKLWSKEAKALLIIGFISILVFSSTIIANPEIAELSDYQFKITYTGEQEKVVKSIGFAPGIFTLNVFEPYETPEIHYGNDEMALVTFFISTSEASDVISASDPYMYTEDEPSISFMIWNGSTVEEALLNDTSAVDLLREVGCALDPSNTEGRSAMYDMAKVFNTEIVPSDINGDYTVDIVDIVIAAIAFGSKPGDPNWNPIADVNNDLDVDIVDIVIIALEFGETC